MDTPKKAQICTPLSKFEDSPVFKFINSLSPIKPVNSIDITHTFNPLSFTSPPSVFTSPHISAQKEAGRLERPHSYPAPFYSETNDASEVPSSTSVSVVPFIRHTSEEVLLEGEAHQEGVSQIEQNKEITGCDWEGLISDAADLLIVSSSTDPEAFRGLIHKSLEPGVKFCTSLGPRFQGSGIKELSSSLTSDPDDQDRDPLVQDNEDGQLKEIDDANYQFVSNLHCGTRRRCLDFETSGGQRKNSDDSSKSISSVDKQLEHINANNLSSRCILPGIGLHLNALAITPSDNKNIKHETLPSGRQKISFPNSSVYICPYATGQEDIRESLTQGPTEKETDLSENGCQLAGDASEAAAYMINEEFSQGSPKRKRRKSEAGEAEACKRCNCKKSKCLKLYCECFAAGVYCIEPCSCQDCYNKPIHEDTVLATRKQIESRNPLAFAPKVIRSSDSTTEVDDSSKTPASARHKRGCNCKKSSCLKKYCECYQGGVGCSINCRCEGCKNVFGRKDGSDAVETEGEPEEETDTFERSMADKVLQKAEMLNNEEQNPGHALPTTPRHFETQQLVRLPFSSKSKLPRSLLAVGSSSGVFVGQGYGKPNILKPLAKCEKHFPSVEEDEMSEILGGNGSPTTTIKKTLSPNSKRISPPNFELASTPGRKLVLQFVPPFPSLTPHH